MYLEKYEFTKTGSPERMTRFKQGDRVITYNSKKGTIVRLDKDELGEYLVVQLDVLSGEYAYEPSDLKKLQ